MFHYPHVVIHLLRFRNCFLRFTHLLIAVQFRNSFLCAKKRRKNEKNYWSCTFSMYNVPVFVQEQGSERNTAIVPGDDCCRKGGGNKRVLFSFHTRAAGY